MGKHRQMGLALLQNLVGMNYLGQRFFFHPVCLHDYDSFMNGTEELLHGLDTSKQHLVQNGTVQQHLVSHFQFIIYAVN